MLVRNRSAAGNRGVGFARTSLSVTSPGLLKFRVNEINGLELRINDQPIDLAQEFSVTLPAGLHRMTWTIDQAVRTAPIQLELLESPGNGIAEFPL